jgi:hypothetical protein
VLDNLPQIVDAIIRVGTDGSICPLVDLFSDAKTAKFLRRIPLPLSLLQLASAAIDEDDSGVLFYALKLVVQIVAGHLSVIEPLTKAIADTEARLIDPHKPPLTVGEVLEQFARQIGVHADEYVEATPYLLRPHSLSIAL